MRVGLEDEKERLCSMMSFWDPDLFHSGALSSPKDGIFLLKGWKVNILGLAGREFQLRILTAAFVV